MISKSPSFQLLCLVLLMSFIVSATHAQGDLNKLNRAKEFYKNGQYEIAYNLLYSDSDLRISNADAQLLLALTKYHLNELEEAERRLKKLVNNPKRSFRETLLYLGRIYHAKHEFQEASKYYKSYLKLLPADHPHRGFTTDAIRRCANGLQIQYQEGLAFVENLGEAVNSKYDEFGPVLSPNFSNRLYFSSARPGSTGGRRADDGQPDDILGKYRYDMFSAVSISGKWKSTKPLHYFLNTSQNEVALGFNATGKVLYYYRGSALDNGAIYVDTFREGRQQLVTEPLFGPVDPVAGISAPHFADNNRVIFASRRAGGYGGYDLYQVTMVNGEWSIAQNLGPSVNTPYDEVSPFLAKDGKTLYFSSNNREYSLGGMDVFKTVYNPNRRAWSKPFNLGLPINSAGDDSHFRLAKDGYTAYFSSNRKDSFGKRDLYIAYFYDFLSETQLR